MRNFGTVVALCVVAAFAAVGCSSPTAETYAAGIDRESETDVALGMLRETDPAFYGSLRGRASTRLASGDSPVAVRTELMSEIRAYTLRQAPYVAAAPAVQLIPVVETERDLIRHLQATDIETCAAFAMRGLPSSYRPRGETLAFVNTAASARLVAAKAGRETPVSRGEVTESDAQALYTAMAAKGLPEAATMALFDGSLPIHPARTQCDVTVAFYDVMLNLPPESRQRVAAVVLKAAAEAIEAESGG